jgi:tetratricopeptide (TPR) repeat protein
MLRLQAKGHAAYRQACQELLDRYGQTKDPWLANHLAWHCTLVPDAVRDPALVLRLAEFALAADSKTYGSYATSGAALYRVGRYETAAERLETMAPVEGEWGNPLILLYLAMAHCQLQQFEAAGRRLNQAIQLLEREKARDESWQGAAVSLSWVDRAQREVLRREAESLIRQSN